MGEYDTSIRVNTKVDNSGLKDTEKEIDEITKRLEIAREKADALADAGAIDSDAYKEAKQEVDKLTDALEKSIEKQKELVSESQKPLGAKKKTKGDFSSLSDVTEDYASRLKYLRDQGLGFGDEEYDNLYIAWKNAADAEKEYVDNLNKLTDKAIADEEAKISQEKQKQEAEEKKINDLRENAVVSNQKIVDLLEEATRLEERKAELKKAGITDGYKEYDEINERLGQIKKEINEQKNGFDKLGKNAKKAFKSVDDGAKKSGGLLKTFSSRLKGITLSLLVFNWITKGFNAMVSSMKEGFNNLVQYSDKYNDAMSQLKSAGTQLKNSLATAFAPIVTMVIPYLLQLIDCITIAANKVSEFMAIMSGASSWTKAVKVQEDYAASLNNTAKASDKASGALASFDSLNVLSKSDSASGNATSPKDMFEEVTVDNKKINAFQELANSAQELKDIFAEGFGEGLGDFDNQIWDIRDNLISIKDSLFDIFTDGEVVTAAQNAFQMMAMAAGQITGSFISVGATIAQNLAGGIATFLSDNSDMLQSQLIDFFNIAEDVSRIAGEAFEAFAYVFSAFGSENGQLLTANLIGIFVIAFLELNKVIAQLITDTINIITKPFIDNKDALKTALEGLISTAATVIGTLKDAVSDTAKKIDEVYKKYFKPFFDSLAQGLSDLAENFLEFWNESVQPLLDKWAREFDALWKESIQPMLDNFIEMIGQIAELLMVLWENYMVPFINWIIDNVLPVLLPIMDGIVEAFFYVLEGVSNAIKGIIEVISGITDFLIGVFTGDWERAWNGITKIFEGVENTIKGIVNGILGVVESLANGVVDAINTVIRAMNNLNFDIPDWVPGIGGKQFGFNISELNRVSIPRLADGAVIRGGNPFAAILGDQPVGKTNIETPLTTIEDAVRNVVGERTQALNINLNYDGETFARLSIPDLLGELKREGYDVEVLGGAL